MAAMEGNFLKKRTGMLQKINEISGKCGEYIEDIKSEHYADNKTLKLRSYKCIIICFS
jgi:hypothetical protein